VCARLIRPRQSSIARAWALVVTVRVRPTPPLPADTNPLVELVEVSVTSEHQQSGGDQFTSDVTGWHYQEPSVIPAASAKMSLRPSAIWRSSSMDSTTTAPAAVSAK
jgi:hypothetical protein